MLSQDSIEQELPENAPKPERLPLSFTLWLLVLGLTILFIPIYYVAVAIQNDVAQIEADLQPLEAAMTGEPGTSSGTGNLNQSLVDMREQVDQFTAVSPTLAAANINWPIVINAIRGYDSSQIALNDIVQTDSQIAISGRAVNDNVVVEYARGLETSGAFTRVVVQSIVLLDEPFLTSTPTATSVQSAAQTVTSIATSVQSTATSVTLTPSVTSTPRPTWTPSPDLRDAYEWDDNTAKPIFLGQAQTHSFYPTFDVDNVSFLAKAGRIYHVSTTNLAAGVDTFLTVGYGDTTLTNDDAELGTLASLVTVQAPIDADVNVHVRITNRGSYGDAMTYQILVQEFVPTSTPTAVPVTPSATPLPTSTATPTKTPSPTPDLRDNFEPDDPTPAQIAFDVPQIHNFYPDGDVDYMRFPVKERHTYEVVTSELAPGVDTEMTVSLGAESWENDDYVPPGSGNLASAVCFATTPGQFNLEAVVTVENKVRQYAPDKLYTVTLADVPDLLVNPMPVDFGTVLTNVVTMPTQMLSLSATQVVTWTAVSDTPWLQLSTNNGTIPAGLTLTANIDALALGLHEGNITFTWSNACQKIVPVSITVAAPTADLWQFPGLFADKPGDGLGKRTAFQGDGTVEFVIIVEMGN